eukprot:gb/GECH01004563.1/.p1 GENE.gb/GECH01004563.1/~~gb/GECH01004563.1/.p1  ORF type:complete len:1516 (+),score=434.63 gb/GECH01004563.1/:1-4548(+)
MPNQNTFFQGTKRGEISEWKAELNSDKADRRKEAVKKVIAAMTVGKDVSILFADVVKCVSTSSIELKKLVYLYIMNYAKTQPELAIMAVNTFVKDATHDNTLIRALAVRTMGCIRVDRITEYLAEPLRQAMRDSEPYVRKTAAVAVAKLFDINNDLVVEQGFIDSLRDLLRDANPMVVANAVAALSEVAEKSSAVPLDLEGDLVNTLLAALNECTEWGQVFILDALVHYRPASGKEAETLCERILPRLSHANSAVVLSAVKVILRNLHVIKSGEQRKVLLGKLAAPLVTLLTSQPEVQYVALRNINIIAQKYPSLLAPQIKVFFCKYNDPIYVKMEKLDIMVQLASERNINNVLSEFKEYATEIDVEFVRRSVGAIGRCAVKLENAGPRCIDVLLELIGTKVNYVVQEAIIVIRDIFRRYPGQYEKIIGTMCENLDTLDEPEAKAAMIWIIGEYAQHIANADELLEMFVDTFHDESTSVQLQLLTAIVKLFLKRPSDTKALLESVLKLCMEETDNPDLRDRGYVYWRLLRSDATAARRVVLSQKPEITDDSSRLEPDLLDQLLLQLSSLASVYHKPPELFVPDYDKEAANMEKQEDEDEDEDEDEEMETSDDDDEEEEEELFDDDEEDDLDISWKVRKAATKCLSAVARTRLDYLGVLYTELLDPEDPILIKRFKEREHRVKVDNLNTFADIVNASVIVSSGSTADGIPTVRQRSEAEKLKDIKDITIKYLRKQLKAKKDQVRNTIFTVLKSFTIALQGELGDNVPSFVNMLQTALNKKQQSNSTLKIEALNFLRLLLASHDPQVFKSHIKSLSDIACTGAQDKYFKITSESLKVCGQLVKVNAVTRGAPGFDESVQELFEAINNRLQTQDIDQDVKESAINSMGLLIAHLGDVIQSKLESCLNLLMERMKNEITRTTATKAFGNIAESSLEIDLSKILPDLVTYLADFLRKNDRTLKQATLTTLICIIVKYGNSISSKLYDKVISESVSLISDSDLQISHLALDMLSSIIDIHSASTNTVEKQILPKMLVLLQSSTLQGQALTSMQQLLGKMTSHVKFSDLLKAIVGVINQDSSKQVYNNVAKCVAVVIVNADAKSRNNEVESFIKSLKNTNDDNKKTLSLFCLGEIGISIDLSSHKSLKTEIESCFESGSEELKNAASFALGNVAVGNLEAYLPSILSEIQQKSKRKYLLLHSLKEIITRTPIDDLRPFNQQILPLLFEFTQVEEDGVRNIVAECLGKSALVDPESVFPMIKEALSSGNEHKRSTVVSAMKYTITEQEQKVDDMLNKDITTFTNLLTKSQPVSVRRAVILMINAAAHNKPKLLKDVIAETLPKIYEETPLDKSLIREIKLGPFTHKVDDGLDLRKATFECLDTLHDNCLEYIDPIPFIDAIKEGLSDRNQDIRMLTYIVLSKLCESSPGNLFSAVDQLVPPLEATLKKKLKENAVQQEKDRHEEEQRAVLRLVNSINVALKVNKADTIHSFDKLFTSVINANQELKAQYQQISGGDDIVPMEM